MSNTEFTQTGENNRFGIHTARQLAPGNHRAGERNTTDQNREDHRDQHKVRGPHEAKRGQLADGRPAQQQRCQTTEAVE